MNKTNIAMKSTAISIIIFFVQGILTFWRTDVIISTYGVNINSIIQASGDVFSYLILLESGLGAAYLYKMYKPVSENNDRKVFSLFLGLKEKLKRVAVYMVLILFVVAVVYPYFLGENDVPYLQSTLIIIILGLRFIFPYYFTLARKNILKAEEKQYIVTFVDGIINSAILFGEIALALWFNVRVEVALAIGLVIVTASHFIYKAILKKRYGHFENEDIPPSYEGDEMTNDIIVHQVAGLANSHIDVFILSLVNLPAVTTYAAYNTAISYPTKLVSKIIENIRASIGLKMSANDRNLYSVFREILSLNYFVAVFTIPVFIIMINEFITLWIGEEFLLGMSSIVMFALILFHRLTINFIYIVRDGRGLYKESKIYTILTAVTNAVMSAILVNFYSINGLLFSTVFSNYFIMDFGNLRLVYNTIFKKSYTVVLKDYVGLFFIVLVSFFSSNYVLNNIFVINGLTWETFIIRAVICATVSLIISFALMWLFHKSFRKLIKRILSFITNK